MHAEREDPEQECQEHGRDGGARPDADQNAEAKQIAEKQQNNRHSQKYPRLPRSAAQADHMGHKAVGLATGDPNAQAAAWRLIAESLRARGRNDEASAANAHADLLVPH